MSNNSVVSIAKPHSIKKFELITRYVSSWAPKLLNIPAGQNIVYIDCMCNCGYYYDENKQLIEGTAIQVAKLLDSMMHDHRYNGKTVYIYFNDKDEARIAYLREQISRLQLSRIDVIYSTCDCDTFLSNFDFKKHKNDPTLLLYDPYEADIDWEALSPFLNRWGEVIINHMVSDTQRGACNATRKITVDKYQRTYQKNISDLLALGNDRNKLEKIVESIIQEQTIGSSSPHFIAAFPFYNRSNCVVYNLIFVTGNLTGFNLFKTVAWQTFGDKSSLKETPHLPGQFSFLGNFDVPELATDENCYYISDIAKYIYRRFHSDKQVTISQVYNALSMHPIFPLDGYKQKVLSELKSIYHVIITGKGNQQTLFFLDEVENGLIKNRMD